MYRFEIHMHTSSCSRCSRASAEQMIDSAIEKGYDGVVITEHFYHGNTCIDRDLPWKDFVGAYAESYYRAREYGKEKGLVVLFGLEESYAPGKEILIYGLSPEIIADCPEFRDMNLEQMSAFVHRNGGIIVLAHPYRNRSYIPDPEAIPDLTLADGIEALNPGNKSEENIKAFLLAVNHNMPMTTGSDAHVPEELGITGIDFEKPVKDYAGFLSLWKEGKYQLFG